MYNQIIVLQIQDHDSDEEPSTSQNNHGDLEEPLVCGDTIPSRYYSLDRRVELGEMANLFFNKMGRMTFYCSLCIYLYGDLSIYSAAVAKSIMDVVWWVIIILFILNISCSTVSTEWRPNNSMVS